MREQEAARSGKSDQKMLVGNLNSTVDFLDVRDVVRAYTGLAAKGVEGETYNVCSGVGTQISEILDAAINLTELNLELEVSSSKSRKRDEGWLVGDNQKLRSILDWTPQYSLRQTIQDTLNAWRAVVKKENSS